MTGLTYQEFVQKYDQEELSIIFKDIPEVLKELEGKLKEGDRYLAYNVDIREGMSSPLTNGTLVTFRDGYSAAEYCYENSTDIDVSRVADINFVVKGLNLIVDVTNTKSKLGIPEFKTADLLNIPAIRDFCAIKKEQQINANKDNNNRNKAENTDKISKPKRKRRGIN